MSFADKCVLVLCAIWVAYSFIVGAITYFLTPAALETLIGAYLTEFLHHDLSKSLVVGGFGTLVPFAIAGIYYTVYPKNDENKTTSQQHRAQK